MSFFIITFLIIYAGLHIYVLFKLRNAFKWQRITNFFLTPFFVVMTSAPFLVRLAEYSGMPKTAQLVAWPGFVWMGFIFIFASLLLCTDLLCILYRLTIFILTKQFPVTMSTNSASKIIVTTIIIAVTASGYACLEASQIRTEHVTIYSAKLPASIKRIRIVQISDVHIGLLMGEKRLGKIATKIAGAKPDILVSTGDLLDGKLSRNDRPAELDKIAALLTNIPTPYGKFAVIGNHEVYAGLAQAVEFSRKAGFNVLRNQSLKLRQSITISGVDDRMTPSLEADIINRTSKSNSNSFNLLLKHRPDIVIDSDGKFDLQLSGHVHKGQIFPFNFLVKLKHPIPCGLTTTPAGSSIYISRGTGTWGPPMRLFAPPEITIIDIVAPQLLK